MLDIKFLRNNPEIVKENIKKKFQDSKLPLVDEVIALDKEYRESKTRADYLRSQRNAISKQIGGFMAKGMKAEAEEAKAQVTSMAKEMAELEEKEVVLEAQIKERMMVIPNIIDPSVPIGKDDSENVEVENSVNLLFLTTKFLTTSTSWNASTAWIWTLQEEPAVPASTI